MLVSFQRRSIEHQKPRSRVDPDSVRRLISLRKFWQCRVRILRSVKALHQPRRRIVCARTTRLWECRCTPVPSSSPKRRECEEP